jgi:tetratricopeptide (TPR) repeat protein
LAPISLLSLVWLAFSLAEIGQFTEGIKIAQQATQQAEVLGQSYSVYHAYWALGAVYLERGEHQSASGAASRLHRIGTEHDFRQVLDQAEAFLGYAHALAARYADALPLLEKVVATEQRPAIVWQRDLFYGDTYFRCGRWDDALRVARRALEIARGCQRRAREAYALRLLGDVYASLTEVRHAVECSEQGLALATELGMRPVVAHCHLGLGKLFRRTGDHVRAQEHLTTATAMYRERGHAVLAGADGGGGEGARVSREDAPRAPHHATRGYSRGHQRRRRQGRLITLPRPLVLELGGSHAAGLCVDVLACPARGPLSGAPAQARCAFGGAC